MATKVTEEEVARRAANDGKVLDFVKKNPGLTKTEIADGAQKASKLLNADVSRSIDTLCRNKDIVKTGTKKVVGQRGSGAGQYSAK